MPALLSTSPLAWPSSAFERMNLHLISTLITLPFSSIPFPSQKLLPFSSLHGLIFESNE